MRVVHNLVRLVAFAATLIACDRGCSSCSPPAQSDGSSEAGGTWSHARVQNRTGAPATVFISFGAGSKVTTFPFCGDSGECSFTLAPGGIQDLPAGGSYLNATISFNAAASCNVTLGEIDISNPAWTSDTANISLVNGWSNDIEIDVTSPDGGVLLLGPTQGPNNNANVFGVYPNGCDICVAKQIPPCGITPCGSPDGSPASCGCKAGTQYNPTIPCQASFARDSAIVTIAIVQLDAGIPVVN